MARALTACVSVRSVFILSLLPFCPERLSVPSGSSEALGRSVPSGSGRTKAAFVCCGFRSTSVKASARLPRL